MKLFVDMQYMHGYIEYSYLFVILITIFMITIIIVREQCLVTVATFV